VEESADAQRGDHAVQPSGALLSGALAAAGPTLRAWQWGPCDPEGFAAMGVAETLLHTRYFSGAPAAENSTALAGVRPGRRAPEVKRGFGAA
jgi:hypothetical protein